MSTARLAIQTERRSYEQLPDDGAVVGATGSIGRLVVEEAIRQGHAVRALDWFYPTNPLSSAAQILPLRLVVKSLYGGARTT
jgi:hypothetical protein